MSEPMDFDAYIREHLAGLDREKALRRLRILNDAPPPGDKPTAFEWRRWKNAIEMAHERIKG